MDKNDNTEKKGLTFPVNQATLAGVAVRASFNEKDQRANVTLMVSTGKDPQYMNVLISGKERYANFKENYNASLEELGKSPEGKQIQPCMYVTGQSFFGSNTAKGKDETPIKHQNYTLIATGNLKENTESYQLTGNKIELDSFRSTYNSQNPAINHISIRGRLSNEPKEIEGKNGPFFKLSIAHNYVVGDKDARVMYANVIVPASLLDQMKQAKPEKGMDIFLSGKVQPLTYESGENKIHSFNIVTTSLQRDNTNTTTVKKAAESINKAVEGITLKASESIDKVAEVSNKKERLQEAAIQKEGLTK